MGTKDRHPGPQRALHVLHLWSMVTLIATGLVIHRPPAGIDLAAVRFLHITVGMAALAGLVARVYYAFAGGRADWREFGLGPKQWRTLPGVLSYYFFLRGRPQEEGYNPLQRLTYILVVLLVLAQSWYGIMLAWPETFARGKSLLLLRGAHYAATWLLLGFIVVHLYLVLSEAREHLPAMLLGRRPGVVSGGKGQNPGAGHR